jgi:uncharacterized protein (DUF697 family)
MRNALLSREQATRHVHVAAACGSGIAFAPVPGIGTAGLVAVESGLIYTIGKDYGVDLSRTDIAVIASTLGAGSLALRAAVNEVCNWVPVLGWAIKASVAAAVIESIGAAVIEYFEQRYPGRYFDGRP